MSKLEQRVEQLESKATPKAAGPLYVSFATAAEAEAYTGPPVKGYIGVSPDDWPAKTEVPE